MSLGHCNVFRRADGTTVARCSCGQKYEGRGAAALLDEHLDTCPDEVDAVDPSSATEAWVEGHYDATTMTLDEWKAQR